MVDSTVYIYIYISMIYAINSEIRTFISETQHI